MYDPHIWLDLSLARKMVDNIASGLSTADPEHADLYAKNAEAYKARLAELDTEFASIVKKGIYLPPDSLLLRLPPEALSPS